MTVLDPAEFRKLTACLARLASNHDGEVVAAARAAGKILNRVGRTFGDLVPSRTPTTPTMQPVRGSGHGGPMEPVRPLKPHQHNAWLLLTSGFAWDDWERKFLTSLRVMERPPSEPQSRRLAECRAKAVAWRVEQEACR